MKEAHNCEAVYIGRRLFGEKARQVFLMEKRELIFSGIRGVFIGFTYKCGKNTIKVRPESVDKPQIINLEWEAKDALVTAFNKKKRLEREFAKKQKKPIKLAIAALAPLFEGLDYSQSDTLIRYLAREVLDMRRKKK